MIIGWIWFLLRIYCYESAQQFVIIWNNSDLLFFVKVFIYGLIEVFLPSNYQKFSSSKWLALLYLDNNVDIVNIYNLQQ